VHFSKIRVSDLLLIDEQGQVIEGDRRTNKAAFWIHSSIHHARPDVVAVAHAHTIHGRAFASLNKLLDPIVQESCAFAGDHVLFDEYKGLVLERRRESASPTGWETAERRSCAITVAHRGSVRRGGGLVVRHDGPRLPDATAGRRGRQAADHER